MALRCLHCKKFRGGRGTRGLCMRCYRDPETRYLFPILARTTWTEEQVRANHNHRVRKLPEPTTALPGTEEKLQVLEKRAAKGEQLWHPLDPVLYSDEEFPARIHLGKIRYRKGAGFVLNE